MEDIQEILDASDSMVAATPTAFRRYLFSEIDWRDRLICIEGARGSGKSTLMRQKIRESFSDGRTAVRYHPVRPLMKGRHEK